jgi:D-glycero-alpha-D-manno-heptose-7-phosphate kinase
MIITRTPFRLPLGGGGTDLPSYYGKKGGFLVSAAIDKYMYIVLNQRFEKNIRVSYSTTEIVESVDQIQHPIVREAMRLTGVQENLEIISVADLPANSGMGSSSSFAVGLLGALHQLKGDSIDPQQLAEEAFQIEVEILGEPIGKQDQYIAAFGGVKSLEIDRIGQVKVNPVLLPDLGLRKFETCVLLFYTGVQRRASHVLGEQSEALARDEAQVVKATDQIKLIGFEVKSALEAGDIDRFGQLLKRHWKAKKLLSPQVSSGVIDEWYELALTNGAISGKIMGAGGGGFFMFYCPAKKRDQLSNSLIARGLTPMEFAIEPEGSKVLLKI